MDEEIARYRDMADRCRLLAEGASTEHSRETSLNMAEDFDREVKRLEARTKPLLKG